MIENNTIEQIERIISADATNIAIETGFGGLTSCLHPNFGGPADLLPDGSRAYCDNVPFYLAWVERLGTRDDGVLSLQVHVTLNF